MPTVPPRHCNACGEAIWHRQAYWEFHCWPSLDPRTYCIDCITHIVVVSPLRPTSSAGQRRAAANRAGRSTAWPREVKAEE